MIPLSLRQFASAVGADPKWVLNAAARVGRPFEYTADDARWLRLARSLNRELRIPLPTAATLATAALEAEAARAAVLPSGSRAARATPHGAPHIVCMADVSVEGLRLTLDLERNRVTFAAALAAAIAFERPKRAGRKRPEPRTFGAALVRARKRGIELGLLRARLRREPAQRMARAAPPADAGAPDIARILACLKSRGVCAVIAGEVAEAVHGGADTLDGLRSVSFLEPFELCYEGTDENLARLHAALRDLEATPRHDPLTPDAPAVDDAPVPAVAAAGGPGVDLNTLASMPALALATRHGAINVRRHLPGVGDFDEAARCATSTAILGSVVPVLELSALCRVRRAMGGERDIQRLVMLEAVLALPVLEERRRDLALTRARWTGA